MIGVAGGKYSCGTDWNLLLFRHMKRGKTLTILEYELPIVIQEEKTGDYSAKCRLWKDCYAQGDSIEEVINEISYVASGLIELYKEEGLRIPLSLKKTSQKPAANMKVSFPLIVPAY